MKIRFRLFPIRRFRRVRRRRVYALGGSKKNYQKDKEAARVLVHSRLAHFNQHYQCTWGKVAIRNQRSRWGSCSKAGNLNFNYRILHLTPELQDYIIVHELCHLREFNHAKAFWDLVAETIPDYVARRTALKRFGSTPSVVS